MQKTVAAKGRRTYLLAPRIATHFPRRRTSIRSILLRVRARLTSRSCSRKTPDRISQRAAFNFGKISINNSLKRFAVTMSILGCNLTPRTSLKRNCTPRILFRRWFAFAVEMAIGSLSIPIARVAPRRFAARARIPVPVPRSTADQPGGPFLESFSSKRSDIAVVACSPVPKAAPAGMINRLFRIVIGLVFRRRKSFNQLRGSFSIRPPKSLASFSNLAFDSAVTCICNLFRLGNSIVARELPASARTRVSFSRHHFGLADFRHKYMR